MPSKDPIIELFLSRETYKERSERPGYKNAHDRAGAIFLAFFPSGITLTTEEDFARFQFFSMCISKMNRYAGSLPDHPHYDSVHDLIGYAATLAGFTERNENHD